MNEAPIAYYISNWSFYNIIYDIIKVGDRALEEELNLGFIYVNALCEKLKEYEGNRDKYKNFKEFYLELISVFKEA